MMIQDYEKLQQLKSLVSRYKLDGQSFTLIDLDQLEWLISLAERPQLKVVKDEEWKG